MAGEAAAKKKKDFLALVGKAFIAISSAGITFAILGKVPTGGEIEGCNDGKAKDCMALLERNSLLYEGFDISRITNEEYISRFAEKFEAARKAEEERIAMAEARKALEQAMAACEKSLKATIKDLGSFKVHNRNFETLQIEYSVRELPRANTNSFGGRIRNVMDCKTGENLR